MAGYNGYSMSNNAISAYIYGEMPLSKWTKKAIIEEIEEMELTNFKIDNLKKLNLATLKELVLEWSSWHHTSKFYNRTDFYQINVKALDELTDEKILELVKEQKNRKASPEEITAKKEKQKRLAQARAEKAERVEKEKLFRYQKKYKTMNGFLNGNLDFEKLAEIRKEKIKERREYLREIWTKQGIPEDNFRWKKIDEDDFIEKKL